MTFRYFVVGIIVLLSSTVQAKVLSPYDFGLAFAKNGVEVYNVLLKTHEAAIAEDCKVTYKGIRQLNIEIPDNAWSIPLPREVDFHGVKLIVKNTKKAVYLFSLIQEAIDIKIDKNKLDEQYFSDFKELAKGYSILVVEDRNPWVKNRKGYDYGAVRKDIILIYNGQKQNNCVFPYSNSYSGPVVSYCNVDEHKKEYKNLCFERTADSEYITKLIFVKNQYNVILKNIKISTPKSELYGDMAIAIYNTAKVLLEDVIINGTYSARNKYGYGIALNNVWNSKFVRLKSTCEWGVFGNYNVNYAVLKDCDINRFDIHCYGKDVYCKKTVFRDWYNQFSSFYGELVFKKCRFVDFVPVLFEPSFYAYTPFDLIIKDCEIKAKRNFPYLINAGNPEDKLDVVREELKTVSWPNVTINRLKVNLPFGIADWGLFGVSGNTIPDIEYMSSISIKGLEINGYTNEPYIHLSNKEIRTKENLKVDIKSSNVSEFKYSED